MKARLIGLVSGFILILSVKSLIAAPAGSLDQTFEPGLFFARIDYLVGGPRILSVALSSDSRIYVGGHITDLKYGTNWIYGNGVYRLNSDGSPNLTFAPPVFGGSNHIDAHQLAVDNNGNVWAGFGGFSWEMEGDGTVERNPSPTNIAPFLVYPDGRTLASTGWPPVTQRYLANGDPDPSFIGNSVGSDLYLTENDSLIRLDTSTDVTLGTNHVGTVTKLKSNGEIDLSFEPVYLSLRSRAGIFGIALEVLEKPNGQLYVSGGFDEVNNEPHMFVVRLQPDGAIDRTFNVPNELFAGHFQGRREDFLPMAVQRNGKLLIAGNFTNFVSSTNATVLRLNPDGSLDTTFENPVTSIPDWTSDIYSDISHILIQDTGDIVFTGNFQNVNSYSRDGIARLIGDPVLPLTIISILFDAMGHSQIQ
jgi:uncharacterized delta-60 repeat protein